jgi:ribosomal-protein-alanine N-acetyltransferase
VTMSGAGAPLSFRRMTVADLPGVLAIERRSFPRPWSEASFRRELALAWSSIDVALEERMAGARVIGYACTWRVSDEVQLMNVAVHPGRRRRGVGRRLVERVLSEAVAHGATAVVLEVRSGNAGARRLYADFGFRQIGIRRSYYGPGQDALVLQRLLDRAS